MAVTVHTSATVRDITAMAKRILKKSATIPDENVAHSRTFLLKLGQKAAKRIDWKHLQDGR
jgi:hypothetical protein